MATDNTHFWLAGDHLFVIGEVTLTLVVEISQSSCQVETSLDSSVHNVSACPFDP